MKRILIFGNAGAGKSTLARSLCAAENIAHLDLDTLAWNPESPPTRRPLPESRQAIRAFVRSKRAWVIEGCYTDLLEMAAPASNEIIFLQLPVADCIANARSRPWEPHKYPSKAAQDANLEMLVAWIAQYPERGDDFSERAHQRLYEGYEGRKTRITGNPRGA